MFRLTQRIRFSHCDPAGILYFAHVFDFVNATVEDWFEQGLGLPFYAMHGEYRMGNPIVRTHCEFVRACRFGEELTLELTPIRIGRSSMDLRLRGVVAGEERFRLLHRTAMISMETLRAVAIPDTLRARALSFAEPSDESAPAVEIGPPPRNAFVSRQLVRYEHCDPGERVYFARFFDMFNAALEDWFAEGLGCPWGGDLMVPPRDLRTPSLRVDCEFQRACVLGEKLDFHLWPTRLGRSSIELAVSAHGAGTERLRARWIVCMVSHQTWRAVPIPAELRSAMERFVGNAA